MDTSASPANGRRWTTPNAIRHGTLRLWAILLTAGVMVQVAGTDGWSAPATGSGTVVLASPADDEGGGVVPAGGVVAARRASQCGGACGRADCGKCRGGKVCRHAGACGPEIPGCPAHCPVRPDRFGYYQTNWRRWPGQAVTPASFNDAAVPVSPPRSVVPGVDDEAGSPPEDEAAAPEAGGKNELPEPQAAEPNGAAPEAIKPLAPPAAPEGAVVPETPPETPANPRKPKDDLFEQSRAPQRNKASFESRLIQWRAKRKPTVDPVEPRGTVPASGTASTSGTVLTSGTTPVGAANLPASLDPTPAPTNPMRR